MKKTVDIQKLRLLLEPTSKLDSNKNLNQHLPTQITLGDKSSLIYYAGLNTLGFLCISSLVFPPSKNIYLPGIGFLFFAASSLLVLNKVNRFSEKMAVVNLYKNIGTFTDKIPSIDENLEKNITERENRFH